MHVIRNYIISTFFSFFISFLFYAIYNQWIIVHTAWQTIQITTTSHIIQKKEVIFHYFHGNKWKTEKQELLWHDTVEKNIFHITNAWLILLDEEHITNKKTTLQSVLITSSNHAYISFDHNILGKEETIFKKWMLVEGLFKTLHSNGIAVSHIQFLVQYQPMQDTHLDFSLPWPIHGFIE